jgi:hypothetical protein
MSSEVNTDHHKNDDKHIYCNECLLRRKIVQKSEIFNTVNDIIYNSITMADVHNKMDNLKINFDKWLELNDDGYSVFHIFACHIARRVKKYYHIKPRIYAFFQKILTDNTVTSIFDTDQINIILKLSAKSKYEDKHHTILCHLVKYCENSNDLYYKRLMKLITSHEIEPVISKRLDEINVFNNYDEYIPFELKNNIAKIIRTYKYIEDLIMENINKKHKDFIHTKCIICGKSIDYIKKLPKIITYAKKNNINSLLDLIWFAYYQRKLSNTLYNKYYLINNYNPDLITVHQRHKHILNLYSKYINTD